MSEEKQTAVEENNDDIDLLELIGVLLKYKWLIIGMTVGAAVLVVAFSILTLKLPPEKNPLPNMYTPSALVLINDESSSGMASLLSSIRLGDLAGLAGVSAGSSYGALAEKLLLSKSLLDVIAAEFEMTARYKVKKYPIGNTRKVLKDKLSVNFDSETSTLSIAVEDYDALFAKQVVDRLVEELADVFSKIGGNRNITKKNLLEQKLAEVEVEIAKLEADIQLFQVKHGTLDVESLAKEQVTAVAQLKSQLILRDMEIKTYVGFSQIDDPIIRRMRAERGNLAMLIDEMESGYSEYDSYMPSQDEFPKMAIEFEHLKRNLQIQASIFEILTQQYELAKLNVEGEEPIFQILELADVPDLKSGPSRGLLCIAVTAGAFLFSILLAFLLNAIKNVRNDPEKMKRLKIA